MESKELRVHCILLWSFTLLPRPRVVIPFTAVQECAALSRSHLMSSQNLNTSRGVSSLDRRHREFQNQPSLSIEVGLYAVLLKKSEPIEGGRDVKFNVFALVEYLQNFVRAAPDNIEVPFVSMFGH